MFIIYLALTVLHMAIVLLDVVFVFVVVRMLVRRWPVGWLTALDVAGTQIVDGVLSVTDTGLSKVGQTAVRTEARLALCLIGLSMTRLVLWSVYQAVQH